MTRFAPSARAGSALALAASLCCAATLLAGCEPLPPPPPPVAGEVPGPQCILSRNINHTETPDDRTILFVMNDRTVIKNTLLVPCSGLTMASNGFAYAPTNPATGEICGNMQTIRLIRTGQVCMLGAFSTLPPSPPKGS